MSSRAENLRSRIKTRRRALAVLGVFGVLISGSLTSSVPVNATGEVLGVVITQADGTLPFDAADGAGLDSGVSNNIVRTNDLLVYSIAVSVNGASGSVMASNLTATLVLPRGVEVVDTPICGAGSTVTPATLPAAPVPTTPAAWLTLPRQTLVCKLGNQASGVSRAYPIPVKVRGEVPNGSIVTMNGSDVGITTDYVTNPVVPAGTFTATVSARAKADLDKTDHDTNYAYRETIAPCPTASVPGRKCWTFVYSTLIAVPLGGKGSTPLASPLTFTDDVTPAMLLMGWSALSPAQQSAILGDSDRYGVTLASCDAQQFYLQPGSSGGSAGGAAALTNVRDSGAWTCAQPGGPGTPISVSIANADTTAASCPSEASNPVGYALPADKCYMVSGWIRAQIPIELVTFAGIESPPGTTSLNVQNQYTNFSPIGMDGSSNLPSAEVLTNNTWKSSIAVSNSGAFSKFYAGVPNTLGNTPAAQCDAGYPFMECPTGQTARFTGDGTLLPGQVVLSSLDMRNNSDATGKPRTYLVCDSWDPAELELAPGNYGPATGSYYKIPSNGAAVWMPVYGSYPTVPLASIPTGVVRTIEYGSGAFGAGTSSQCDDASSSTGWSTTATAGNNKVRVLVTLSIYDDSPVQGVMAVALRAKANPVGTILDNYAAVKQVTGVVPMAEMLDNTMHPWTTSVYDPNLHTGIGTGDRIKVGEVFARLNETVKGPSDTAFHSPPGPPVKGGSFIDFKIQPSLNAGINTTYTKPVVVEDCLSADVALVTASPAPTYSGSVTGAPTNVGGVAMPQMTCAPGDTYVVWDLGEVQINSVIPTISYRVKAKLTASAGAKTNMAVVSTTDDSSTLAQRTFNNQITIVAVATFQIEKSALTPLVDVNRVGETNPDPIEWQVDLADLSSGQQLSDMVAIDVLPFQGSSQYAGSTQPNGSRFTGTLAFDSVFGAVDQANPAGGPISFEYTSAPSAQVAIDPIDPSNGSAGSTTWCTAPSGGTVVSGTGTCPTSPATITGVRAKRPGFFIPAPGGKIAFKIRMIPRGNTEGDIYENAVEARMTGIAVPVGLVASTVQVVSGSIGDFVFIDKNANGFQDTGEPGVAGASVRLSGIDSDGNTVAATTATNASGNYTFANLPAGIYTLTFDYSTATTPLPPNAQYTAAKHGVAADNNRDSDALAQGTGPVSATGPIVLPIDHDNVDVDAGIVGSADVSGHVYGDRNDDGIYQAGAGNDRPINGVTVTLTGVDGLGNPVTRSMPTNSSGAYSFSNVLAGTYTITEDQTTVPSQYLDGKANVGSLGATEGAAGAILGAPSSKFTGITVVTGDVAANYDFFEPIRRVQVGDLTFEDVNGDGIQNTGDVGLAGVTLHLTLADGTAARDVDGNLVADQTTTSSGAYLFANLPPAAYKVTTASSPVGYKPTKSGAGTPATDSSSGSASTAVLTTGQADLTLDFGFVRPVSVGDYVFEDAAGDGIQNAGDVGLAGATLHLTLADGSAALDVAGAAVADKTTTASGAYTFTNLPPGAYKVALTAMPTGYVTTKVGVGTVATDSSSGSATTGVLTSGMSDLTLDFGFFRPVSVGDYVFSDANHDGIQNAGDAGFAGVTLHLTLSNGSAAIDVAGSAVADQTTTSTGAYAFTNLPPGTYTVATVAAPAGAIPTVTGAGTSATDSSTGSATVTLASGGSDTSADFGYYQQVSVGDFVFEDTNLDGIQDPADLPLAGVVLHLSNLDGTAVTSLAGQPVADVTTGSDGRYVFTALVPAAYKVTVVSTPAGCLPTKTGAGTPTTDSSSGSAASVVLTSGGTDMSLDFGFYRPGSLGNLVWLDTTPNGRQDAGEPGVANVAVTVQKSDGTTVATTTTDATGTWRVSNLLAGSYIVNFVSPAGYGFVPAAIGEPTGDSNPDPYTGTTAPIILALGQSDFTVDAGLIQGASIDGNVYFDKDGSKTRTPSDAPIVGVVLTITGTSAYGEVIIRTAKTDANGHYHIDLVPGTYTVTETQPAGYLNGVENPGSRGGTPSTDRLENIPLKPGDQAIENNFGERVRRLPTSGSDIGAPVGLAVIFLTAGLVFVLADRRRRRATAS